MIAVNGNYSEFLNQPYAENMTMKNQTDIYNSYEEKLRYEFLRKKLELDRQQVELAQKLEFEKKRKELQIQFETYFQMTSSTVFKDSSGDLIYALKDVANQTIISKQLLNVKNYETHILVSYYPSIITVMEVSWGEVTRSKMYFSYKEEGIQPNQFLKRLKGRGILLLVSGRTEKKAAEALLAYSLQQADTIELSPHHGWVKMGNGNWHFANQQEFTMQEVQNYV